MLRGTEKRRDCLKKDEKTADKDNNPRGQKFLAIKLKESIVNFVKRVYKNPAEDIIINGQKHQNPIPHPIKSMAKLPASTVSAGEPCQCCLPASHRMCCCAEVVP